MARRINVRNRSSDRKLLWSAVAVALCAHAVFFSLFGYRVPPKRSGDSGSAVTLMALGDMTAEDRRWFSGWLEYHDPRNSDFGDFGDEITGGVLHEIGRAHV